MGDTYTKNQISSLAITAIVTSLVISSIWFWLWSDNRQLNDQSSNFAQNRIEALEQQLQQRNLHEQDLLSKYQDLLNKYSEAADAKTVLESNLAVTTAELENLQKTLADYQLGDWERKYLEEKNSNDQIFESMARQEKEMEILKENQEALVWEHKRAFEIEQSRHLEQINVLNSKLAAASKTNKKLKEQAPPVVTKAKEKITEDTSDYRSARLLSLINSIDDLPSQKKLEILIKVIPTVPDGITTNELTKLSSNMNSEDILLLIKSSERHIQKTKDKKSITLLLSKMNNPDADAASKLLVN